MGQWSAAPLPLEALVQIPFLKCEGNNAKSYTVIRPGLAHLRKLIDM